MHCRYHCDPIVANIFLRMMHGLICLLFIAFLSATDGFFHASLRPIRAMSCRDETTSLSAGGDAGMKKFCVSVNLYVKPERREEFLQVIAVNSAGTLSNEPLNISYTWGESTTEKNTFHFQEQFKGKEGFEAHTQTPHFAVWQKFADAEDTPFWKPPVVFFFETC